MRLFEVILKETSEEDRAIVSLSDSLFRHVKQHYSGKSNFTLGAIGDIFNTPLEILNPVKISFVDVERLNQLAGNKEDSYTNISAVWEPVQRTIFVNNDRIDTDGYYLQRIFAHELRHALDDYKSDFRAGASTGYDTPKNPIYRTPSDAGGSNAGYLARPSEINARYAEVLTLLVMSIRRAYSRFSKEQARVIVLKDLDRFFERKKISDFFPEKTQSSDYKRLLKRAVDFIDKEGAHIQSQTSKG